MTVKELIEKLNEMPQDSRKIEVCIDDIQCDLVGVEYFTGSKNICLVGK